jgi:hypothetical protein
MTDQKPDDFEYLLQANRSYSVQKPEIDKAARRPADGLTWRDMKMPDSFDPPPDFSFGGEGTRPQTGQPRSKRAPGD